MEAMETYLDQFMVFFQMRLDFGEKEIVWEKKTSGHSNKMVWESSTVCLAQWNQIFMGILKTINVIADSFMYFLLHNVPPTYRLDFVPTMLY